MDHSEWRNRWKGGIAVCLASGPSLTEKDIAKVFEWREQDLANRYIGVVNTTFQKALRADVLFGHDYKWWNLFISEVKRDFTGARVAMCATPKEWNVKSFSKLTFKSFGNGGADLVSLMILAGCSKVILLGYDCQHGPGEEVHHHGDHPKPLGNAYSMPRWPKAFYNLSLHAAAHGVEVVNCSRRTALTCFPRGDLDEFLHPRRAQRLVHGSD